MPRIANFGCEYERIHVPAGYECVNVDVREIVKPDVVCNLADKLPFDDGYFDHVYASHVLEHFSYRSTVPILMEWRRVIKPGGKLEILVPSFEYVISQYAATGNILLPELFGGQNHLTDVHFSTFDKSSLTKCLKASGYDKIAVSFRDYWGHVNLSLVGECINPYQES